VFNFAGRVALSFRLAELPANRIGTVRARNHLL
jgi:hypothetical protein